MAHYAFDTLWEEAVRRDLRLYDTTCRLCMAWRQSGVAAVLDARSMAEAFVEAEDRLFFAIDEVAARSPRAKATRRNPNTAELAFGKMSAIGGAVLVLIDDDDDAESICPECGHAHDDDDED